MTLRQALERYGVAIGVVVALVIALVALPGNAKNTGKVTAGGSAGGSGSGAAGGTEGAAGNTAAEGTSGGGTGGGVSAGGTGATATGNGAGGPAAVGGTQAKGVSFTLGNSGPHCRGDGRQIGVSYAMPPCATWTSAPNNGGATARGVTKDKILVIRYLAQIDPGTRAILTQSQLSDDPPVVKRAYEALFRYNNLHMETYGREVVMQDFNASGPPTSDEASLADAIKIANDIKPFAVVEGDPAQALPLTLIKELARRNVACFCTTSGPSDMYTAIPPIVFSPLPTIDEYVKQSAEYICKHLNGQPAEHAGTGVQGQPRKFGLIYLNGQNEVVVPEAEEVKGIAEREFGRCGITFAKEIGYSYDPGRNQSDVTNMIAQMRQAQVTTIVPYWDPLYPILITQEATRQVYFPEWFMTGTGLSDTTTAGRLYDQQQWAHAFGISPLWITWATVAKSAGYREYHWARPGDKPGDEGVLINVYRARIAELFTSIQMAGPLLTNDSLTAGTFGYPKTGGTPGRPLLYRTRAYPTAIKDFSEVWYDSSAQGPDERGQSTQTGMVTRADGGARYQLGQWYTGPPHAFRKEGSVTVTDDPPGGGDWPSDVSPNAYPATKACLSCP